jgi:hypothetical protein
MAAAGPIRLGEIVDRLTESGLIARGAFNFDEGEVGPTGPGQGPAKSVLLVGNAGDAFWPNFRAWLAEQPAGLADPLDSWSRRVLEEVAEACGARLVIPNDRPYAPFQQWAMRAEGLKPSPLGILMHPEYGLWHAYRGALLFDCVLPQEALVQPAEKPIHPCDLCDGKPCLNACPAGAFETGFDSTACLSHIVLPDGAGCMKGGCLARNACPYDAHRYGTAMRAFLMRAFRRALVGEA